MAAPSFIQEAETTAWDVSTSPRTTGSFTVQAGDILVAWVIIESSNGTQTYTIQNSGTAFAWTLRQEIDVNAYTSIFLWTASASAGQSNTVTFTRTVGDVSVFGGNVLTFRTSDGVGASSKTNVSSGAPTLNLTTTQADSAIVVVSGDWNAIDGASRLWRTGAGALTEQTYFRNTANYAVYGGYHANAGAIGTKAVGQSAPSGQKYSIAAVEVKGTVGGGGKVTKNTRAYPLGIQRGWSRRQGMVR